MGLLLHRIIHDDAAQGLAEYGLILAFVAVVCIVALTYLSGNIQSLLSTVANDL